MKFISLCSGIEAASVAFKPLGWQAIVFSEIEPFPCAVLAHHYPDVPNIGDMTKFREWPEEIFLEADAIVGGPPCQAFSVAGLREGLADARGNLTITYTELINHADAIRVCHGRPAVIALYENVPGLLSDKTGAFGCLLGALAGESLELRPPGRKWTHAGCVFGPQRAVAWRVLDAQYFNLAQRRQRVFIIASARNGFDPAAVLFECEGLRRDTAPSREAGEVAPTIPSRSTAGGGLGTDFDCDGGLICKAHGQGGAEITDNQSPTLTCIHEAPLVSYSKDPISSTDGTTHALGCGSSKRQESVTVAQPIGTDLYNSNITGDVAATMGTPVSSINASGPTVMVGAFKPGQSAQAHGIGYEAEIAPSLEGGGGGNNKPAVHVGFAVRRLTPVECSRLQGFPDDYLTQVPWRGKTPPSDGPMYKALGNSWPVPVVTWIGRRIQRAVEG